jgi:hypothetical protein
MVDYQPDAKLAGTDTATHVWLAIGVRPENGRNIAVFGLHVYTEKCMFMWVSFQGERK